MSKKKSNTEIPISEDMVLIKTVKPKKTTTVKTTKKTVKVKAVKPIKKDKNEDGDDSDNENKEQDDIDENDEDDGGEDDVDDKDDVEIDDTDKKTTDKKKSKTNKKGPGRPRKTPKKEPIVVKGIVSEPTNPENVVELLYSSPLMFKKIVAFLKSLAVVEIQIIFRIDDVIFYALDHHKNTDIRIRIDASHLGSYYCKSIVNIGVKRRDLELLFNKVDKTYNNVMIISNKSNIQQNIVVMFEDELEVLDTHIIDVHALYPQMTNEADFINENYMIKFKTSGKYFRKMINDYITLSTKISMTQEDCKSPIEFEYDSDNKKIRSTRSIKNAKKFDVESNLADGDSFRIDVYLKYLHPISNNNVADTVMILADENKKLMTKSYIGDDNVIEIKTLTEIIDKRNPVDTSMDG